MKSSLSSRLKKVPSIKSSFIEALYNHVSSEKKWCLSESKGRTVLGQTAKLLFICVLISIKSIECVDANISDRASPGEPCICNSTFYKSCPPDPHCKEDAVDSDLKRGQDFVRGGIVHNVARHKVADDYHDYDDPDHVDAGLPIFGETDEPPRPIQPSPILARSFETDMVDLPERDFMLGSFRSQEVLPVNSELQINNGEQKIVRHRKVYVKENDQDPVIHPLRVTIPVKVEYPPDIPTPKPVYKLRKYTTYEEKPEIKMVPVVKTIIKPANVSPDQIIE